MNPTKMYALTLASGLVTLAVIALFLNRVGFFDGWSPPRYLFAGLVAVLPVVVAAALLASFHRKSGGPP